MTTKETKEYINFKEYDSKKRLKPKEKLFVAAYIKHDYNGGKAYSEVYPDANPNTARNQACRMLKKERVRDCIESFTDDIVGGEKSAFKKKVLGQHLTILDLDITDLYDDQGDPKKLSEIDPKIRKILKGYEKKYYGKNADISTGTITMPDKKFSRDFLNNLTGLSKETTRKELTGKDGKDLPGLIISIDDTK